jgi:hypothetical protein
MTQMKTHKEFTFVRRKTGYRTYYGGIVMEVSTYDAEKEKRRGSLHIISKSSVEYDYKEAACAGIQYFYEHFEDRLGKTNLTVRIFWTITLDVDTTSSCILYAAAAALCEVFDFKIEGFDLTDEGILIMPLARSR